MLAMALIGCATYEPANLPPEQGATVIPEQDTLRGASLAIAKVDGQVASNASALGIARSRSQVMVAPRVLTIGVNFRAGTREGSMDLPITIEAGHFYLLRAEDLGSSFKAWLVDNGTVKPK